MPVARTPRASAWMLLTGSRRSRRALSRGLRFGGHESHRPPTRLPHHKLVAYQLALELVQLVAHTRIADAHLRQQARKSASSCALNTAEGAARQTLADKSRAYAIALTESCEACAAVEIAGALGACAPAHVEAVVRLGVRLKNVLSRLVR
jgi:four helix bundle protein